MKSILFISVILVAVSCLPKLDILPDTRKIKPPAARVKAVVDSISGVYKVVLFEINGVDSRDSLRKYTNFDSLRFSFIDYDGMIYRKGFDYGNPNIIPTDYSINTSPTNKKISDSTSYHFRLGGGGYSFYPNRGSLDSIDLQPTIYYGTIKEAKEISNQTCFKFLAACSRKLRNDSLILENSSLKSILTFKKIYKQ